MPAWVNELVPCWCGRQGFAPRHLSTSGSFSLLTSSHLLFLLANGLPQDILLDGDFCHGWSILCTYACACVLQLARIDPKCFAGWEGMAQSFCPYSLFCPFSLDPLTLSFASRHVAWGVISFTLAMMKGDRRINPRVKWFWSPLLISSCSEPSHGYLNVCLGSIAQRIKMDDTYEPGLFWRTLRPKQ